MEALFLWSKKALRGNPAMNAPSGAKAEFLRALDQHGHPNGKRACKTDLSDRFWLHWLMIFLYSSCATPQFGESA
jgi:hypothetical protein